MRKLILAKNFRQAEFHCREIRIPPSEWRLISGVEDLRGAREQDVIAVGQYWEARNYFDIVYTLKQRACRLLNDKGEVI